MGGDTLGVLCQNDPWNIKVGAWAKVLSVLIWGMLGDFSQIIDLLYSKVGDHFCDKQISVVVKNLGFQVRQTWGLILFW